MTSLRRRTVREEMFECSDFTAGLSETDLQSRRLVSHWGLWTSPSPSAGSRWWSWENKARGCRRSAIHLPRIAFFVFLQRLSSSRRHNAEDLPPKSYLASFSEVTEGTEASCPAAGDGAEAAGYWAARAELLDGNPREKRAVGAAELPEEGKGVYLPPSPKGEVLLTERAAEFWVHRHRSR